MRQGLSVGGRVRRGMGQALVCGATWLLAGSLMASEAIKVVTGEGVPAE